MAPVNIKREKISFHAMHQIFTESASDFQRNVQKINVRAIMVSVQLGRIVRLMVMRNVRVAMMDIIFPV